jgi:hypothetical protein
MDNRDKIKQVIDEALLNLYNASNSGGEYTTFNFYFWLRQFNDMLNKYGCNEYYRKQAAKYISVWEDLATTPMIEHGFRVVERDDDMKTVIEETLIFDRRTNRTETYKETKDVSARWWCYKDLEIPEKSYNYLSPTTKYFYLVQKCTVVGETYFGGIASNFGRNESFRKLFTPENVGVSNISFEGYVLDLIEYNKVMEATPIPPQQSGAATADQPHFTREFTGDEQKKLFEGLTGGGFIAKGTIYSHFCFIFGGTAIPDNETPFKPLQWQKTAGLLAYFIDNTLSDTDNQKLWETTTRCFMWHDKAPNKNTMKNTVSKYKGNYKDKPKGYEPIDAIINSL